MSAMCLSVADKQVISNNIVQTNTKRTQRFIFTPNTSRIWFGAKAHFACLLLRQEFFYISIQNKTKHFSKAICVVT